MAIRPKLSRLRRASASVAKILTEALKSMAETHWEEAGSGRPNGGLRKSGARNTNLVK